MNRIFCRLLMVLVTALAVMAGGVSMSLSAVPAATCAPTPENRPVCPEQAPTETATFIDPTVRIAHPRRVGLGRQVYVMPFSRLVANAPIMVGDKTSIQDNADIIGARYPRQQRSVGADGHPGRHRGQQRRVGAGGHRGRGHRSRQKRGSEALGLRRKEGVKIGEGVLIARGARVVGPARIGVDGPHGGPSRSFLFLGPGSEVDGAVIERNAGLSVLARVGPGVVLHSGFVVLAGKNVTTQAEADDPSLGKVRPVIPAVDLAPNPELVEGRAELAEGYTRLYRENPSNVWGINFAPATSFKPGRQLPRTQADVGSSAAGGPASSAVCGDGVPTRVPGFRNRVIGAVCFADSLRGLNAKMRQRVSIRADEGGQISVGHFGFMSRDVVVGTQELVFPTGTAAVVIGDGAILGTGAIVFQTAARSGAPAPPGSQVTVVGQRAVVNARSVIVGSRVGAGSVIGRKSFVSNSDLPPDTMVPDRSVVVNGKTIGRVEW